MFLQQLVDFEEENIFSLDRKYRKMEKMRDAPFAEQALNLIKTRGLLNAMSEFEKMKAYSE